MTVNLNKALPRVAIVTDTHEYHAVCIAPANAGGSPLKDLIIMCLSSQARVLFASILWNIFKVAVKIHNWGWPMRDASWIANSVVTSLWYCLDQVFNRILVENDNHHMLMDVCQTSHDNIWSTPKVVTPCWCTTSDKLCNAIFWWYIFRDWVQHKASFQSFLIVKLHFFF